MRKTLLSALIAGAFTICVSTVALSTDNNNTTPTQTAPAATTPDQSTTPTQPANGTTGTSLPVCKVSQSMSNQLECNCSQGNLSFTFDANMLNLQCK